MVKKKKKADEEAMEQINCKMPASVADWLRGASAVTQTHMAVLLERFCREGLERLEKAMKRLREQAK